MVSFEVGTTSVVGDVIVLEATVRFHPKTILFNGCVFVRKEANLDSAFRDSNKFASLITQSTVETKVASDPAEDHTRPSSNSLPPPPPPDEDRRADEVAPFCAVCGKKNEKMASECAHCLSSMRISVLMEPDGRSSDGRIPPPNRRPPAAPLKEAPRTLRPASPALVPSPSPSISPLQQSRRVVVDLRTSPVRSPSPASQTRTTHHQSPSGEENVKSAESARARSRSPDSNASGSDREDPEHEGGLRQRREAATAQLKNLPRSNSAQSLSAFKKLEEKKRAAAGWSSGPKESTVPKASVTRPTDDDRKEPTHFCLLADYDEKDPNCFTATIKCTSREDHVYFHIEVRTMYANWIVKRRESEMFELWTTLTENRVEHLPPRPRRATVMGRRTAEDIAKRTILLQEMLSGIFSNKRAMQIRATSLFLELYRSLL